VITAPQQAVRAAHLAGFHRRAGGKWKHTMFRRHGACTNGMRPVLYFTTRHRALVDCIDAGAEYLMPTMQ